MDVLIEYYAAMEAYLLFLFRVFVVIDALKIISKIYFNSSCRNPLQGVRLIVRSWRCHHRFFSMRSIAYKPTRRYKYSILSLKCQRLC